MNLVYFWVLACVHCWVVALQLYMLREIYLGRHAAKREQQIGEVGLWFPSPWAGRVLHFAVWEIGFLHGLALAASCTHLSSHKNKVLLKIQTGRLIVSNTSHELVVRIQIQIGPKSVRALWVWLVTCISFSLHQILCKHAAIHMQSISISFVHMEKTYWIGVHIYIL
jgi:hypothetical protein